MHEESGPVTAAAQAELADYVRATLVHLVREVGAALVWAAVAMGAVVIVVWGVSHDFPGRLLAGTAGVLVAGAYLRSCAEDLPRPDRWLAPAVPGLETRSPE